MHIYVKLKQLYDRDLTWYFAFWYIPMSLFIILTRIFIVCNIMKKGNKKTIEKLAEPMKEEPGFRTFITGDEKKY